MPSGLPRKLTLKYYAFIVTGSEAFVNPILTLYMLSRGLSYTTIGLISGVWWVAWVLSEIPTGYVGDRFGRKNSLLIGTVIKVIAIVGFGLSGSALALGAFYAVWAVGITFRTGALSAWLYDLLQEEFDEEAFAHVQGRGSAFGLFVGAGGSVVGGYLGGIDYLYPFLLTGVVTAIGFFVVLSFPGNERSDADPLTTTEAVKAVRREFARPPLRSFVLYTGVLSGVIWMVYNLFLQPIAVDLGFAESDLGWIYAGMTLVAAGASYLAGHVKDRIGIDATFLLAPLFVGGIFVAAAVSPILALPAFFAMQSVDRLIRPLRNQYINDHTTSTSRATVLSTASMVYGLIAVPIEMTAGSIADALSPLVTMGLFGGLVVVVAIAILLVEPPFSIPIPERTRGQPGERS